MEDDVVFLFQLGVVRDAVTAPAHLLTLAHLKELAVKFVHEKVQKQLIFYIFLLNRCQMSRCGQNEYT